MQDINLWWKLKSEFTYFFIKLTEKIVDFIKVNELDQDIIKEKIKNSNESEGDIEENSGVDFPGF